MTSSPLPQHPTHAVDSITLDPDFVLPERSHRSPLPTWLVVLLAVATAWATTIASRRA